MFPVSGASGFNRQHGVALFPVSRRAAIFLLLMQADNGTDLLSVGAGALAPA